MSEREQSNRHTIDADEATMEEMRRFAEEARRQASGVTIADSTGAGDTIDADADTMAEIRHHVEAARRSEADTAPDTPLPERPADAPVVVVIAGDAPTVGPVAAGDDTQRRPTNAIPVPPPPDLPGERWRPPPRTVLPAAPVNALPRSAGPWKPLAIGLAVLVVVLTVLLLVTQRSDDDAPPGSTVPGSSSVPADQTLETLPGASDDG